jgi:hypothetical protein
MERIALALLIAVGLSGCSSAIAGFTSSEACVLKAKTWTCDPSSHRFGTVTLTGNQTIVMSSGSTAGELFTIRLGQDATGGRIPTWGPMFLFRDPSSQQLNALTPLTYPKSGEDIQFQYDNTLSKWEYLSRSGVQQIAPSFQGGGTGMGAHLGNNGGVAALPLAPNTNTKVFYDNGGFFPPEGGGVVTYYQLQVGIIQVCNYGPPTLVTFHCSVGGGATSITSMTAPDLIASGSCREFGLDNTTFLLQATTQFGAYACFINPGNSESVYATWNSVYNEEIPAY